jgi:hypothetical protein
MAQGYTPGLKVSRRAVHRVRRVLPIVGDVLVRAGQRVAARDVVARALLPGPITPVNVANLLGIGPADVPAAMQVRQGRQVAEGDLLARSNGIFGWFRKESYCPCGGTVESISPVTGQVILRGSPQPVDVRAFLSGTVVEVLPGEGAVIEAEATWVQGIFGVGGEAYGALRMACGAPAQPLEPGCIDASMRREIVVGGGRVTALAIRKCLEVQVAAIIAGGIDDQDLREFLGYDLGVATTGSEKVGLTLIVTEGFGEIAMAERTYALLRSRAGCAAAVNGTTQIRAGVQRPEILIPWVNGLDVPEGPSLPGASGEKASSGAPGRLEVGAMVRIIRDPYFGIIGTVAALPAEPRMLGSGSKARVLEVRLPTGEAVQVPRANVELIEG